ncbi:MAG: DUF2064 domain-containing protein [Rubrobacter sp.]|nr:DUF2064 domain-containing protein [Rubrobacter sp.]
MRPLVSPLGEGRVLIQGEGDWTERQRELFGGAAGRGEDKVVLIASDSPHLTVEVVVRAFEELDRRDLVLGPTFDGGYYLGLAETVREMGKEATGDQNKVLVLHGDAHAQAIFETNQGGELMQAILERLQKYR